MDCNFKFLGQIVTEKEAKNLFGNMREATVTEQKSIQKNIDKIAVPTGINFWANRDRKVKGEINDCCN